VLETLEAIKAWAFPQTLVAQVLVGLLLALAILLTFKIGQVLWPSDPENGVMRAFAILVAASTFVAMKAIYLNFGLILVEREAESH